MSCWAISKSKASLKIDILRLEMIGFKAWIDTRNLASVALVKKLGMEQFEFVKNADYFKGSDSDEYVFQITFEDVETTMGR